MDADAGRNDPELAEVATEPTREGQELHDGLGTGGSSPDENEKSARTSSSHWDPSPGFACIDGDVNGSGYNETNVDIVAVPCPGADPIETWARDPLPDGYFEQGLAAPPLDDDAEDGVKTVGRAPIRKLAGGIPLTPGLTRHLPKSAHIWVRQGIRREISNARVLLYRHGELVDGTTIDALADDLLAQVWQIRGGDHPSPRPLFFIAHSIGGLVLKAALVKAAKKNSPYRPIMYDAHGVTFFATPHRGSSYLSMGNMRESIQQLLHLQKPLPTSLTHEVRVGHKPLLKLHSEFTGIASEMRLWSFYETVDSQLSGTGAIGLDGAAAVTRMREVDFGAPIASIKSSLVGTRREEVFSLESTHANCASFGTGNTETMSTYLRELAGAVEKATELTEWFSHTPMNLGNHVKVEVIGFYEDMDVDDGSEIRLYFTKLQLTEFLEKGPERCLEERLSKAPPIKPLGRATGEAQTAPPAVGSGLNILSKIWKSSRSGSNSRTQSLDPRSSDNGKSPDIVVDPASARPSIVSGSNSMPAVVMRRLQSLTVPALATPIFGPQSSRSTSTASDPAEGQFSPTSGAPGPSGSDTALALLDNEVAVEDDPSEGVNEEDFGHFASRSRPALMSHEAILQEYSAGFSRPDPSRRKFMWIHTPCTNPPWVKDVFSKISETHSQDFDNLFGTDHWESRHVQGRRSQSQPSFVKPTFSFISGGHQPPASPRPFPDMSGRSTSHLSSTCFYLYMPFLHFDTYVNMVRRRKLISRRTLHGRARPVPQDVAELDSLELRTIWQYLEYDPPLNFRRTLDQYGYPSLRDTDARDDDQILYKLTKEESLDPRKIESVARVSRMDTLGSFKAPASTHLSRVETHNTSSSEGNLTIDSDDVDLETYIRDGKVLMVDQLWLWAIDTTTLATFFSKRESRPQEGPLFQQADLRNSVYNELNGDLTGRCENALDLAAFVVLHAVTVLLDRSSHPDLEVFRIFEEAISILTERMTTAFRRFRMQTFKDVVVDEGENGDRKSQRTESIKKRHKRELEQAERENRENTSALLELRDIEDELLTMLRLFDAQEAVIQNMRDIYRGDNLRAFTTNGRGFLKEALTRLDEYRTQTREMLRRVDTTRNDYEKLLEMVQRQAQVDEVRWSRLQTELASSQNLSVMIFTTFTVIFLPLTFFTGLFGMNTWEWGALLIAASLVAAYSERVQAVVGQGFRQAKKTGSVVKDGLRLLEPASVRQRKVRFMDEQMLREEKIQRAREGGYDFWATVRRQRFSEHRIPELNRKKA